MGYTVLYIAFGVVALWLLGEVLFQYKAPLPWRVAAFVGFIGVVVGVVMRDVVVIGIGAAAFALGQTFVTVSYRRGYAEGWSLRGGPPDEDERGDAPPRRRPSLRVSEVEPVSRPAPASYRDPVSAAATPPPAASYRDAVSASAAAGYRDAVSTTSTGGMPVYHPQALSDDTSEYAAYGSRGQQPPQPQAPPSYPGDGYTADPFAGQTAPGGGGYDGYGGGYAAAAGGDQTMAMPSYQGQGFPSGFPDPGPQDNGFQDNGFQDTGYQVNGFQDTGLQNTGYQDTGYQGAAAYQDPYAGQQAGGYQSGEYPVNGYQDPGLPEPAPGLYQDPGYQPQGAPGYQDPYNPQPPYPADGGQQQAPYLDPMRDTGQFQPAAYLDPNQYQQPQPPYQDPYVDPQYGTPPGGVWMPQQQNGEQQYAPPPPAADPGGYDPYRF